MERLIVATVIAAAFGALCAPSHAADLQPLVGPGAGHVRATLLDWSWRDRCAWAGYYCLYAEYRYVYHYPWDDRPIAAATVARRHYHRH